MPQRVSQREALGYVGFRTVGHLWQIFGLWHRLLITYLMHIIGVVLSVSHAAE